MKQLINNQTGSAYPFLDARTPKSNSDLLPVKLSVNLEGKQFRIGIKINASRELFEKAVSGKGTIPKEAKQLKAQLYEYLQKARNILEQFPYLNRKTFINLFKSENNLKISNKICLEALFQLKIDELTNEDKAGSISFYKQALVVFKSFRKEFCLEDITVVEVLQGMAH